LKLAPKSITISRPGFSSYARDIPRMRAGAAELFELVKRGVITIEIGHTYPLKDAAQAHRDLEGRKSAGSILLVP
jgi:NADPH2:quinone reductase